MHQQKYFLKLDKEAFIKKAFVQYLRYGTTSAIPSWICETAWQKSEPKIEYSSETAWQKSEPVPEYYIWRTSRDSRVRPSHASNSGLIFERSNPPPTGHPGASYGCRCHAEPYPHGAFFANIKQRLEGLFNILQRLGMSFAKDLVKVNLNQLSLDMAKDFLEQNLTPEFLSRGLFLAYSITPNGLVTTSGRLLAATPFVRKILIDAWKYGGKRLMSPAIDLALEHFNDRIGSNEEMLFKVPKTAEKNKDKLSPNSSGPSSSGDPEDPDEEEKKYEISNSKDAEKVGRTEQFGKIYKDSKGQQWNGKDIWWSKDKAGHGGSKHKLFVKDGAKFQWVADVDELGKVMSKHKSNIGIKINLKDIIWIK